MTKVWTRKTRTNATITPARTSGTTRRRAENAGRAGGMGPAPAPGLPASPCTLRADTCTSVRDEAVTARLEASVLRTASGVAQERLAGGQRAGAASRFSLIFAA